MFGSAGVCRHGERGLLACVWGWQALRWLLCGPFGDMSRGRWSSRGSWPSRVCLAGDGPAVPRAANGASGVGTATVNMGDC